MCFSTGTLFVESAPYNNTNKQPNNTTGREVLAEADVHLEYCMRSINAMAVWDTTLDRVAKQLERDIPDHPRLLLREPKKKTWLLDGRRVFFLEDEASS